MLKGGNECLSFDCSLHLILLTLLDYQNFRPPLTPVVRLLCNLLNMIRGSLPIVHSLYFLNMLEIGEFYISSASVLNSTILQKTHDRLWCI
jgi:hypothetical protein